MKVNADIRSAISAAGLKQWQIAEAYGITDSNFSRILRTELPDSKKKIILRIISDLSHGKDPEVCAKYHEPICPFEDNNETNSAEIFRGRLNYLIVFNRISYSQVARSIGISPQYLYHIKNGLSDPNIKILCKVADYFGVSTDWLLGREEK